MSTDPNPAIWTGLGATVTALCGVVIVWLKGGFARDDDEREQVRQWITAVQQRLAVEEKRRDEAERRGMELEQKHIADMAAAYERYRLLQIAHDKLENRLADVEQEKAALAQANAMLTQQVRDAVERAERLEIRVGVLAAKLQELGAPHPHP